MSDYLNSNKSLKNSDLLKVIEVQQKRDGTLIPAEKTVGQKKKGK